ncbi:MAG: DUF3784 domain-containing protein, partial [Eubacteriales bacterium]|nr:DUF3784 domain-containing protein [Eubacteriales bacterium]
MAVIWFVAAVFAVISVVFLTGRGGFLIAGYNTSGAARKAKYDEKKMCRVMGIGMSVVTIMLICMAFMGDKLPNWSAWVFVMVIIVDIIFMMVWTNTKCYAVDKDGNRIVSSALTAKEDAAAKKTTMVVSVILAVVFIIVGFILLTGDIKITCTDRNIQIQASYWKDCEIEYSDITSVRYSEENVLGKRVGGFGSFKLAMGRFENDSIGRYTRYTYISGDS